MLLLLSNLSYDGFGYLAACIGSLCYGTYGVPIKATQSVDVHPLVLQSYRTVVVFVASVSIVKLIEAQPTFTPFGLLAGLLEVVGGMAGIVAIRTAGIATAVGTWASVMILVNFVWGILIFHEPVRSMPGTCGAFGMLGIGLMGMTAFSSPNKSSSSNSTNEPINGSHQHDDGLEITTKLIEPLTKESNDNHDERAAFDNSEKGITMSKRHICRKRVVEDLHLQQDDSTTARDDSEDDGSDDDEYPDLLAGQVTSNDKQERPRWRRLLLHPRASLTDRQFGIACAMLNGVLGASAMVPLHYAKKRGLSAFSYIFSFVTGVLIANVLIWVIYFVFQCCCQSNKYYFFQRESIRNAVDAMPQWHFRVLWWKLLLAGLLLTGGMIGSVLSISHLGQAVGNSLIQSKILVSGLWGICCFQEIKDHRAILKWFLSATLSVASILWLSFERQAAVSVE